MALHGIVQTRRDEIIARWKARVHGVISPGALAEPELVDHMPDFVDGIAGTLRQGTGLEASVPLRESIQSAAEHGRERLRLGFSLDAVVREYGALSHAIAEAAIDAGTPATADELRSVFDCVVAGIAHAVTEYVEQRDAELRRQANEHFAFIAHELRNPLSSATTALAVLKQAHVLPDHRAVAPLERGLGRAAELIAQSLETARAASGVELQRAPTTLTAIIHEVELESATEAQARGVELRHVIVHDASVALDVRLVQSALGNLVRNAVKYTKPGTVIETRGRIAGGRVILEVEDRCGGLEPGKAERAFAPFIRLEQGGDGFGLGLAIAKQAVDAHGGSIRVQNLPGTGCIFVLELPLSVPAGSDARR